MFEIAAFILSHTLQLDVCDVMMSVCKPTSTAGRHHDSETEPLCVTEIWDSRRSPERKDRCLGGGQMTTNPQVIHSTRRTKSVSFVLASDEWIFMLQESEMRFVAPFESVRSFGLFSRRRSLPGNPEDFRQPCVSESNGLDSGSNRLKLQLCGEEFKPSGKRCAQPAC